MVGCCGFAMPQERYFATFPVVEIQQTFYQPPQVATAERWRERAPEEFQFTLKAWQLITHPASSPTYRRLREALTEAARERCGFFRDTEEMWAAWERTDEIRATLRAPLVVFQCPARFTPTEEHIENLRRFFSRVPRSGWAPVWEPRGEWPNDVVASLCRELELTHCVDPFAAESVGGKIVYYRLHGKTGYRYRYTDADLRWLAGQIPRRRRVYCLFNNVSMAEDAQRFLGVAKR